ncbi:MAG: heme-binding domain-containing protein [Bacteroidota bacterium]
MKKIALVAFISLSVLFSIALVFNPRKAVGSKETRNAGVSMPLPDSVLQFVKKTCMDCHADDGNFMAKGKLNFSVWDKYNVEKQQEKSKQICKELTKKSMPTGKWRKNNPDKLPTQADIDMMCRWANNLQN